MARQRTLKPEFFKDRTIALLGPETAIVYQAVWTMADDGWVARIDPDLLKGEMLVRWPTLTQGRITECLQRLTESGRIKPYEVGDELFAEIPTMANHQKTNRPSAFRYPRDGKRVTDVRAWATQHGLTEHSGNGQ